jgi:hypothetical protein
MISLLAVMLDGRAIETATVGPEGVFGVMAGIGVHKTLAKAVVQFAINCFETFRDNVSAGSAIH